MEREASISLRSPFWIVYTDASTLSPSRPDAIDLENTGFVMRFLIALVILLTGFVGYGAYRQRQAKLEQLARVAALQDSLRRADSLQRQAQADSAYSAQLAARRAGVDEYLRSRTERPRPLKLQKPPTRYVVLKKPVRPKRLP